eukprot:gnl/Carplike_NY0171/15614_a23412_101.p1 GENE.gnl/Carplike_NY0171/15614_a23412_101~~gnl/Carplike_NY0171/15614_a23412_101.p1  ORF type:complete len:122 (+),score=23.72 gnl/Carplike_NY0171/15614_a23412_101:1-366(+)
MHIGHFSTLFTLISDCPTLSYIDFNQNISELPAIALFSLYHAIVIRIKEKKYPFLREISALPCQGHIYIVKLLYEIVTGIRPMTREACGRVRHEIERFQEKSQHETAEEAFFFKGSGAMQK